MPIIPLLVWHPDFGSHAMELILFWHLFCTSITLPTSENLLMSASQNSLFVINIIWADSDISFLLPGPCCDFLCNTSTHTHTVLLAETPLMAGSSCLELKTIFIYPVALMELAWGVLQLKGDNLSDEAEAWKKFDSAQTKRCVCSFAWQCHSHQVLQ